MPSLLKHFVTVMALLILAVAAPVLAEEKLTVYTVNYPIAYFAERIGADQIEVVFPAPADVDPDFWTPDQKTSCQYQQADLILL